MLSNCVCNRSYLFRMDDRIYVPPVSCEKNRFPFRKFSAAPVSINTHVDLS